MAKDPFELEVLLLPNDFNNLKVSIKAVVLDKDPENYFVESGTVDRQLILTAIKNKEYNLLPDYMRESAKNAFDVFIHTQDSQLCDTIIDNSFLKKLEDISRVSNIDLIKNYTELFVAAANIRVAVRACKTNKTIKFLDTSLVLCKTLDLKNLKAAALKSIESIYEYLSTTVYYDAVPHLKASMVLFEKWYDNKIMDLIKKEKSNPFTIAPIIAYALARQNELKVVRIIFSGKRNGVLDDALRERLRCMYV